MSVISPWIFADDWYEKDAAGSVQEKKEGTFNRKGRIQTGPVAPVNQQLTTA
jgi:hypothetical protein